MIGRLVRLFGLGIIALLLQGCPKPEVVIIYNNSGTDFVVQLEDGQTELAAGSAVKIGDEKGAISWNSLTWERDPNTHLIPTLTIKAQNRVFKYELLFRGELGEFVDYAASRNVYALQLESDGGLYIANSKSPLPVRKYSPQPAGFPLMPIRPLRYSPNSPDRR